MSLPSGGPAEWAELRLDGDIDDAAWAACVAADPACAAVLKQAQARRAAVAGLARPPLPAALRDRLLAIPRRGAAGSAGPAAAAAMPAPGTGAARAEAKPTSAPPPILFPAAKTDPAAPAPRASWWRPAVAALLAIGIGMWVLERSAPSHPVDDGERTAKADAPADGKAGVATFGAPIAARAAAAPALAAQAPAAAAGLAEKPGAVVAARSEPTSVAGAAPGEPAPVVVAAQRAQAPVVAAAQPAEAAKSDGHQVTVMAPAEETASDRAQTVNGVAMRDVQTRTMAVSEHRAAPGALLGAPAPAPGPAPAPLPESAPAAADLPGAAQPALAAGGPDAERRVHAKAPGGGSVTTQDGRAVGAGASGGALRATTGTTSTADAADGMTDALAAGAAPAPPAGADQAAAPAAGSAPSPVVADLPSAPAAANLQKSEAGVPAPAAPAANGAAVTAGEPVLSSAPEIVVAAKDSARRVHAEDKKSVAADNGTDDAPQAAVDTRRQVAQDQVTGEEQGGAAPEGAPGAPTPLPAAPVAPAAAPGALAAAPEAPAAATSATWAQRNDGHLSGQLTVTVIERAHGAATVRVTLTNITVPAVRILAGAVTLVADDAAGNAVWRGQARPATVPPDASAAWTWTTPLAEGMTWTARWGGVSATTN